MRNITKYIVGLLLFSALIPMGAYSQLGRPGGYTPVRATDKEVVAATAFAVEAQLRALRAKEPKVEVTLKLKGILKAEEQVVAGKNFRIEVKVNLNGEEKIAEAIVWWQAWRKPEPYELTSWTWK